MSRSVEELWDLLDEAQRMPYGSAQIALVEQVLRHADAAGDRALAFSVRLFATTAYTYGGEGMKSFVTFSWCLADFDRDPAPFHQRHIHTLLWDFKAAASGLTEFPQVPLDRTYALLDDMERRYREGGHSMQAVYKRRYLVAGHVGAEEQADEWYQRWVTAPRDDLSDCAGCDPSTQVGYLADRRRDEEAIALAEPVLAGELNCTQQPHGILRRLLGPYVRTGRLDAAVDAHRRAYRLARGNLADLWDIADHIEFCARTGNEHRGLEILQRHLDWLDRAPSPADGMQFAAAAALLLRRLTELGHGAAPVHRSAHGDRPAGAVPAAELRAELDRYATDLSLRFDARNGTTASSGRIAELLSAQPYPVVLPLSPTARRAPAGRAPAGRAPAGPEGPADQARPAADLPQIPADATPEDLRHRAELLAARYRHEQATAEADGQRVHYRPDGPADLLAATRVTYGVAPQSSDVVAVLDEVVTIGEPATVLDARLGRARMLMWLDRPEDAVDDFVEVVALCAERDLDAGGAFVRSELAAAYERAGRLVEAAEVAEEAVAALHRLGEEQAANDARYLLSGVYRELDDADAALTLCDELIDRLGAAGDLAGRARVLESVGDLLYRADRDAEAAHRFAAAADDFRALGERLNELWVLRRRVTALRWADDVDGAIEAARYAEDRHASLPAEQAADSQVVWDRGMLGLEAGRMLMDRDRYAEAVPRLAGALERLRAVEENEDADEAEEMLAEALSHAGNPGAGEDRTD